MSSKKDSIIVGINTGHDGACAVIKSGKIVATMAEERLTRVKHKSGWLYSLTYCLKMAGIKTNEIDMVVVSCYGNSTMGHNESIDMLIRLGVRKNKIKKIDHHYSHAVSAFYTSGLNESLVFVFDAQGNDENTESVFVGNDDGLKLIAKNNLQSFENGLVATYQSVTSYIGWNQNEAGKTMGLASYGNSKKFKGIKIFSKSNEGFLKTDFINHTHEGFESFCRNNKVKLPKKGSGNWLEYADIAAWIQSEFEEAVIKILTYYKKKTRLKNLCLSGGGALNSVCNQRIRSEMNFDNVFAFPASGDSGQCLGNAIWGFYQLNPSAKKDLFNWRNDKRHNRYSDKVILDSIKKFNQIPDLLVGGSSKFKWEKVKSPNVMAAKLLAEGFIVARFEGGSEIGPRALGSRSILLNPSLKNGKKILNNRVKHRESFRPFACSIIKEEIKNYFASSGDNRFMMFVEKARKETSKKCPSIVHIDGTTRIQTVDKYNDPSYYELIKEFYKLTSIPLILNTSFNVMGEPIVETPFDAIKCFLSTDIDYLLIGSYLIKK